jgi:antitoxin ChpS
MGAWVIGLEQNMGMTGQRKVGSSVECERSAIEPRPVPRYTLAELLAVSDYSEPQPAGEPEWVDAAPVGREWM